MTERDPRVDPQEGDELVYREWDYTVHAKVTSRSPRIVRFDEWYVDANGVSPITSFALRIREWRSGVSDYQVAEPSHAAD